MSWSVDSLDAQQREVLLSVSVFASGFELDAAQAVSSRGDDVVDVRSALVDRSLVTLDRAAQPRRYLMLETLREYVQMQADPAQMRAARAAHARFFTGLAEQLSARLRRAGSGSAWQRMARESNDIRVALSWWLEQGDARAALRTATAMSWFWYRRSHVGEARRALEQTLAAAAHLTPDIDRARALLALGWMHYLTGGEQVLSHLQEAARLAEEAADDVTLASALVWSSYVLAFAGQHEQAHAAVERSLRLAEQSGHLWAAGAAAWLAGNVALDGDDADGATKVLLRSLGHAEGDMSSTLIGLQSLAGALAAQGRAEIGAEVLGAVAAAAPAAGFDPESIGGAAGTRSRRLVVERLEPDAFARAWERGLRLTPAEATRRVTSDAT